MTSEQVAIRGHVDAAEGRLYLCPGGSSLRGWALEGARPVKAVHLSFDRRLWASAELGIPRPDVRDALGPEVSPDSGWLLPFDVTGLEIGRTYWATIEAMDSYGSTVPLDGREVRIVDSASSFITPLEGLGMVFIDHPRNGARFEEETIQISGWVALASAMVDSVQIEVDGRAVGLARCHLPRADLATQFGDPLKRFAGFEMSWNRGRTEGTVSIAARALSCDGSVLRSETSTMEFLGTYGVEARPRVGFFMDAPDEGESAEGRYRTVVESADERQDRCMGAPPKIDVLVATHSLAIGGGQLWLQTLLDGLRNEADLRLRVLSMSDGPLREELVTHGIPVHVTAGLPDASAESYECRVQELTAILTLLGPDAVLCNTIDTFFIASAAQRLGIPVVWAVHEHFPLDVWWPYRTDHTKGGFAFESLLGALRSADKLVFEAEATRVLYREMLETDNGATIYYGVDTEPIEQYKTRHSRMAVRRELGVDDDCVLTLSVGIFEPRKAQAAIVEVFSRMVSRYGSLGLLLVGAGKTPYTENLRSFVDALGFDKGQVLIRPVARDIWRYYLAADLLVSAADIESMPRTFLEAMAFDLPIVTTDVGGCKELVLDGVTGWTTKPKTSVGLEIAWERALSNRSQWADFARVGRLLLERRHDSARHSSSVAQILRSAVGIRAR